MQEECNQSFSKLQRGISHGKSILNTAIGTALFPYLIPTFFKINKRESLESYSHFDFGAELIGTTLGVFSYVPQIEFYKDHPEFLILLPLTNYIDYKIEKSRGIKKD